MPTNRTANAIEIGLSAPTIHNPSAAVTASPAVMLRNTARMMRGDLSASHRMVSTTMMVPIAFSAAWSLMVANSSSWIGIAPVSRSRA